MKYNRLYVFGDSFSTPHYCVEPFESYWGLLAKHINVPNIANYARVGQSWESIMHTLVGLSNKIDFINDLLIIAIPVLERKMIFDNNKQTKHEYHEYNEWDQEFVSPNEFQEGTETTGVENKKMRVLLHDRGMVESMLLRDLFLLTKWLDSANANYYIINTCGKDLMKDNFWGPSATTLKYALSHNRIMFDDTYHGLNTKDGIEPADYNVHSWMGHHGPAGNKNFFEKSLLPELKKANLV